MASDLLSIAKSGVRTARAGLDVTSSNIANASSEGYVRRSVSTSEIRSTTTLTNSAGLSLSGSRVTGIVRNADAFRQSEVRRTGSDAARATAEVSGLENIESALEDTGVYDAIVDFESALQNLASDTTDSSLRAAAVESGRTLAQTFNTASQALDATGEELRTDAQGGVDEVNKLAGELARINQKLSISGSSDQSALLDQRDSLLEQLSGKVDISTSFNSDQTVTVTLGGNSSSGGSTGVALVSGSTAGTLSMTTATDGTVSFAVNGSAVTLSGGSIAGDSLALTQLAQTRTRLDSIASSIVQTVNDAQANGADLDGNTGQALFSGTTAADMTMIADSGSDIAAAAAGSGAKSRDASNLTSLRSSLESADPAGDMDTLLFDVSSAVSGRTTTRDTLQALATSAEEALDAQAGVNLDDEAVKLVEYQQAYQASAKIMQVASDIFDSILAIN